MSHYHPRPYPGHGGPIAKKPRMGGPRGPPHMMGGPGGPPGYPTDENKFRTFKEFMASQSDDISEQVALAEYNAYKTDFFRKQIDKFFKEHQEEEWFRTKYRPSDINKIRDQHKLCTAKRRELFNEIFKKYDSHPPSVNQDNEKALSKFLEDFSLLLEGASLKDLDNPEGRERYSVSAIFIQQVHPSIDKAMIETYASKHPNFLRVAMSDAHADKGFRRRAWITYKRMDSDELKKLTWEFNSNKFNGHEIKTLINKETTNRVKYHHFLACHTSAAKADIKNVVKLLTHFEGEDCPLLESMKDHIIEETNVEEQILGIEEQKEFEFTEDEKLFEALDKAILYLRLVHSFDYYAATEYSGEDDMPQRVGVMFARPKLTSAWKSFTTPPQVLLKDFIQAQQTRVDDFLEKPLLSEAEQKALGKKNAEEEVENFIYQQTFEREAGAKYICKIDRKKFKAPEFVRKHIINKLGHHLDEVRDEVEFFNNYIADPKRPM